MRKTNEKNIPTEQTPPKKDSRVPSPYEDGRRTQSPEPQTSKRTQDARSVSSYGKLLRLRSKSDFQRLKGKSRRFAGKCLCVDVAPSSAGSSRLGISASRKFGPAHERNRFKRLVREAFRLNQASWAPLDLHVIPRQAAKEAAAKEIRDEFLRLIGHASQS